MTINVVFAPPLPGDAPDIFDAKAQQFALDMNPFSQQANETAQAVNQAASSAAEALDDAIAWADVARQASEAADASAALAAKAAGANAQTWTPQAQYAANAVVWGASDTGQQFRCIAAHSGSAVDPWNDPAHWVLVGASPPASPTAGPTQQVLQRGADGALAGSAFVQDGKNGTMTLTRDAQGRTAKVVTVFNGKTRTETITRDAQGRISEINATEV
ncbi:MAG: hypothetical protein LBI48_11490 [Burkholderiaceae bacterium]|jgi:YD repeat-containing protein|nr:hypothetical protein [Burkholderiaceae bacterium]